MKRSLEVGSVLSEAFTIYRGRAGVLLPVAFWLFLATAIVEELAYAFLVTALLAGLLGIVATLLYQGMVVALVREAEAGRSDSSIGDMLRSVRPVLLPLVVASLLAALGILLGTIFFIVPGLVALTFWAVIAPVIVVERTGAIAAFERSQALVGGSAWRVFGAVLLGFLIVGGLVVALVLLAESIEDGPILRILFSALAGTVAAPISGLIAAVLYFRLRELEETPSAVVEEPGHGTG